MVLSALVAPAAAPAQTPADLDTAHGVTSGQACFELPRVGLVCDTLTITVDARSGPSGEDPAGTVTYTFRSLVNTTNVTCLHVEGNAAVVETDRGVLFNARTVYLEDGPVDGLSLNVLPPTGCTTGILRPIQPATGPVEIHDAQPRPQGKADCKQGGWQRFGFKNQGQCVRTVR